MSTTLRRWILLIFGLLLVGCAAVRERKVSVRDVHGALRRGELDAADQRDARMRS